MRISDWSSDVCSSDLTAAEALGVNALLDAAEQFGGIVIAASHESVGHAWHGRVGIAFAAAVAGGRDAHKAGVQAILHIIFQDAVLDQDILLRRRSEEHTSELQSLMRNSYAVFCLKKKI